MTDPRPRPYHPLHSGPGLEHAWTVASGRVAVVGEHATVTLPPGATWPGLDALPKDWIDELQPGEALAAPGSRWQRAAPDSVPAGVALIHAQLLRTGPLTARLARLDRSGTGALNHHTQAAVIGAKRESVTKVRSELRRGL